MRHIKKMSALTSDVRRFVALNPRAVTICPVSFRPFVSSFSFFLWLWVIGPHILLLQDPIQSVFHKYVVCWGPLHQILSCLKVQTMLSWCYILCTLSFLWLTCCGFYCSVLCCICCIIILFFNCQCEVLLKYCNIFCFVFVVCFVILSQCVWPETTCISSAKNSKIILSLSGH